MSFHLNPGGTSQLISGPTFESLNTIDLLNELITSLLFFEKSLYFISSLIGRKSSLLFSIFSQ
ncbi:MAG: hypothetical protein CMD12_00250 [Flavobacteriales bacterium]|nr:hypothetical protein [Flavobacteriales bacterium]